MQILILGGTVFLGRALVDAATNQGHSVTLFNRGKSNPNLYPSEGYPQVETLIGEREGDLAALQDREWDAVIDTCGYVPRIVRRSAEALADHVDHYTFISSLSVYADASQQGIDESGTLATMEDETVEEVDGETYGPLKALCEQAAEEAMPGRVLNIRSGLIVGPHDASDRFTYWPQRVARGKEVLAPGRPERRVQFIDVRDLAEWILRMAAAGKTGAYNANSPALSTPMEEVLETCRAVSGSEASFTWVSDEFLLEKEVGVWMEMPLWIPESDPEFAGFFAFSIEKALGEGLTFRPLEETVRDTLKWAKTRPEDHEWRAGMEPDREIELLEAWKKNLTQGLPL
jgi:2'-hydroxyisoflavone reductase